VEDHIYNPLEVTFHLEPIIIIVIDLCGGAGKNWNRVTIETLPDNTLLEIFDFYRVDAVDHSRGRPWKWHRLAHVCRRWRCIVYTSPRRLDLQILCKSGAPIKRILGTWPTLPLVLRFQGNERSKRLPDNVMIALRHPDRVREINLSLTSPVIGTIAELVQVPFLTLKSIQMASKDAEEPPALGNFLGGSAPLLEEIDLGGITVPFPAMRRLLLSTSHLSWLWLLKIPNTCYFSPEDLVACLSALVHLRRLWVGFCSPASRPNPSIMTRPPSPERTTLPSLVALHFDGACEYLEGFVARIDCPVLATLWIKYFNQLIFEIPQLVQFISRVDGLKSPSEVIVQPVGYSTMSLLRPRNGTRIRGECCFRIPCRQLDWQLSFLTQILDPLSPLLRRVHVLSIKSSNLAIRKDWEDVDTTQWLELFQPLSQTSDIRVTVEKLVPDVMRALVSEDMTTGTLPRLTSLHLQGVRKSRFTTEAAERFVATRKLAGRNIHFSG